MTQLLLQSLAQETFFQSTQSFDMKRTLFVGPGSLGFIRLTKNRKNSKEGKYHRRLDTCIVYWGFSSSGLNLSLNHTHLHNWRYGLARRLWWLHEQSQKKKKKTERAFCLSPDPNLQGFSHVPHYVKRRPGRCT